MIATRKASTKVQREMREEGHLVLSDISWEAFETITDALGPRHLRMAYDDGELELMTTSFEHDNLGRWIGRLIFFLALEWSTPICTGGATTLKKSLRKKGLEPDECFWIANEEAMRGKKQWDASTDPPPDLAVEVDISRSWLDRMGIYAALGVPEVWCYDGNGLQVWLLESGSKYKERNKSKSFPALNIKEFSHFVTKLGSDTEIRLTEEFLGWLRNNSTGPKKQRKHTNGK